MSIRQDYTTNLKGNKKITCHLGDLTLLETDVIVNAANSTLLGGNGVDMAVHRRGGPIIREECQVIRNTQYPHGLPVGRVVITNGGNLKAKYVIHTVGPKYHHDPKREERLKASYYNSLALAEENELESIGFPAISTGAYGYPLDKASLIAIDCVVSYLTQSQGKIKNVVFSLFTSEEFDVFLGVLKEYEAIHLIYS